MTGASIFSDSSASGTRVGYPLPSDDLVSGLFFLIEIRILRVKVHLPLGVSIKDEVADGVKKVFLRVHVEKLMQGSLGVRCKPID